MNRRDAHGGCAGADDAAAGLKDASTAGVAREKAYSAYFGIPVRTVEDWDTGKRVPPPYLLELMAYKLEKEGMMQKDKGV